MKTFKKSRWVKAILPKINIIKSLFISAGVRCEICGPIRRKRKWVVNIIIVVESSILNIVKILCEYDSTIRFLNNPRTSKHKLGCLIDDIQYIFYSGDEKCWGTLLLYCTGSMRFNKVLACKAKASGMRLTARGLFHGENIIAGRTEVQVLNALGMNYIRPELRNTKNDWVGEMVLMRQIKKKGGF